MLLIFVSLILWLLLMWLGTFGPRVNVPASIRGGGGGGGDVSTTTYYSYQLSIPHQSINPNYPIYCYDTYGELVMTIEPNSPNVNYGTGIYTVPGSSRNQLIESIATASYYVSYSTDLVHIDYDKAEFSFNSALISKPTSVTIWATFQYYTQFTAANDTGKIIDGDWSTQMQTIFYAEPPNGYEYAILDLGVIKEVQAIDLVTGYFRPTEDTKFDCKFKASLKYSLDNISYYDIGKDFYNFDMESGESKSFDAEKLGEGFQTRYIMILLESVDKIKYGKTSILVTGDTVVGSGATREVIPGNYEQLVASGLINESENNHAVIGDTIIIREGTYAVALSEASAYSDIILKAESFLIPTTTGWDLTGDVLTVDSTSGFTEPESGEEITAYIDLDENNTFTYTGMTATTFTGVELSSGATFSQGDYITSAIENDTTLYDYSNLLPKLGDRMYKKNQTQTDYLYTYSDLQYLSKEYLKEFVKNHGKIQAEALFAPYLKMGQTVSVTDSYNNLNNTRYFIETVSYRPNAVSATLARYPG